MCVIGFEILVAAVLIDILYLVSYIYLRGLVLMIVFWLYLSSSPSSKVHTLIASDIIVTVSAVDTKTNLVSTNQCFEQDLKYSWISY